MRLGFKEFVFTTSTLALFLSGCSPATATEAPPTPDGNNGGKPTENTKVPPTAVGTEEPVIVGVEQTSTAMAENVPTATPSSYAEYDGSEYSGGEYLPVVAKLEPTSGKILGFPEATAYRDQKGICHVPVVDTVFSKQFDKNLTRIDRRIDQKGRAIYGASAQVEKFVVEVACEEDEQIAEWIAPDGTLYILKAKGGKVTGYLNSGEAAEQDVWEWESGKPDSYIESATKDEIAKLRERAPSLEKLMSGEVASDELKINLKLGIAFVNTDELSAVYTLGTVHETTIDGKKVIFVGGTMFDSEGKYLGLAKMNKFPESGDKEKMAWFNPEDVASGAWNQWADLVFKELQNISIFKLVVPLKSFTTFENSPIQVDLNAVNHTKYLIPERDINGVLYGEDLASGSPERSGKEEPFRLTSIYAWMPIQEGGQDSALLMTGAVMDKVESVTLAPVVMGSSLVEDTSEKGKSARNDLLCFARLPDCPEVLKDYYESKDLQYGFLTLAIPLEDATIDPPNLEPELAPWMLGPGSRYIASPELIEGIVSGEISISEISTKLWSVAGAKQ